VISHHEAALRDVSRIIHVSDGHLVDAPVRSAAGPTIRGMSADLALSADEVADHTFSMVPDGYAPYEVHAYLARLGDELRAASERERALRDALARHEVEDPSGEPWDVASDAATS